MVLFLINKNGKVEELKNRFINEEFLQKLFPKLSSHLSKYLGTELMTFKDEFVVGRNRIDQVAIDREGRIYLIEFKLDKNSSRREVISQLIDYASSLEGINVETFFEKSRFAFNKNGGCFGLNEKEFKDLKNNIEENLKKGEFIFVVVMDKIDEDTGRMIKYFEKISKVHLILVKMISYRYGLDTIVEVALEGAEKIREKSIFGWQNLYLKLGALSSVAKKIKSFCEENGFGIYGPEPSGFFIEIHSEKKRGRNKIFYIFKITSDGKVKWNAWHHGIEYFPPPFNKKYVLKKLFEKLEKIEGAKIDYRHMDKGRALNLHLSNLVDEKELKKFLDALLWIKKEIKRYDN